MRLELASLLCLVPLTASVAAADVVYDNLGTPDDYEPQTGWVVSDGPPFGNAVEQAMPFVPSSSGRLDRAEFPLTMVGGPANATIVVDLYSDAGGQPGTSLESVTFMATVAANPANPLAPVLVADFSGAVTITAGQTYWLVVAHGAPLGGAFLVWNYNVTGAVGDVADRRNGGPGWNVFPAQDLAAFRVSTDDAPGTSYCGPAVANSTGAPATISATGTPSLASNDLVLTARRLPPSAFGFFLVSSAQGNAAQPGGSLGVLCLSGSIGRYVGPGQIQNSGSTGMYSLPIDLTQLPQPTGFVGAVSGETWNFQSWFRDSTPGGMATSNFTDGLAVQIL